MYFQALKNYDKIKNKGKMIRIEKIKDKKKITLNSTISLSTLCYMSDKKHESD